MSLVAPVCCWTPAGEPVLLIQKNSNGSGKIYKHGVIVNLSCYDVALLLLQNPVKREPQPQRQRQEHISQRRIDRMAQDPALMRRLQRQVEQQLGPMPTATPQPPQPAKPSLQERAAALVASRQPRPTEVVEARKAERQRLIEQRSQARYSHRQQQVAEINQQIDALLQEVWGRQQRASRRELVAA